MQAICRRCKRGCELQVFYIEDQENPDFEAKIGGAQLYDSEIIICPARGAITPPATLRTDLICEKATLWFQMTRPSSLCSVYQV